MGSNQLIVSTSFGLTRTAKTLCEVDLAARYETASDLIPGRELLPLCGVDDLPDL